MRREPGSGSEPPMIGLLGPVTVGGDPVPGLRARLVLVALALAEGRTVSAQRLIDDVWGDARPKAPAAALQTQISRLRPILRPAEIAGTGTGYRLVGAETDIAQAEHARSDPDAAESALALWRGEPGDDLDDGDLATDLARRAGEARDRLEDRILDEAIASGEFRRAHEIAERRCAADPLNEQARVHLMRALAGDGRVPEALAQYADLRRVLASELGVDPGRAASDLHASLLADPEPASRRSAPPAETTPLIGRADEVRRIAALVDDVRVVTVLGPGGVGKTRVAEEIARRAAEAGRRVYYVRLASVRNSGDVDAVVAREIGVSEADLGSDGRPRIAARDIRERVVDFLSSTRCLLVLDNCEQVIESAAELVSRIVGAASGVDVLVTSRSPLQINAERVHPLPVLETAGPEAAAVELFCERALAVRPDAVLEREKLSQLCGRLDGLPLAIELAAARMRTLTVEEIDERLGQRFALLRSQDRSAPDRHRTLQAVIDWSWDLLDDDARTVLSRLCRFPAGFGVAMAERVSGMGGFRLDDALTSLVNQSLLQVTEVGGRVRYRMLETVREFGEQQLQGEALGVESAMSGWARERSRELWRTYRDGNGESVIAELAGDFDNLVFVLGTAVDAMRRDDRRSADTVAAVFPLIAGLWAMRGLHGQVGSWGARVLTSLPDPPVGIVDDERERWQVMVLSCCSDVATDPKARHIGRARGVLRQLIRPDLIYARPADLISAMFLVHTAQAMFRLVVTATASTNREVRLAGLGLRMAIRENGGNLAGALRDSDRIAEVGGRSEPWIGCLIAMTTASIHGQQGHWVQAEQGYRFAIDRLLAIGAEDDGRQARGYLIATLCNLGRIDEAEQQYALLAGDRPPADDASSGGRLEMSALILVCAAELARAMGRGSAALYERAGRMLVPRAVDRQRDPGQDMLIAVALVGALESGASPDEVRELAGALVVGDQMVFQGTGYWDLPQAATCALAVAGFLAARDADSPIAAELRVLALRLGARQDYPALHAEVERARARVSTMTAPRSRRQAAVRLHEVMGELRRTGLIG